MLSKLCTCCSLALSDTHLVVSLELLFIEELHKRARDAGTNRMWVCMGQIVHYIFTEMAYRCLFERFRYNTAFRIDQYLRIDYLLNFNDSTIVL